MIKVSSPSHFSTNDNIGYFSGKKNWEDAIKDANEWATRNKIILVAYFEQSAFSKSILVSYKRNKDGDNS